MNDNNQYNICPHYEGVRRSLIDNGDGTYTAKREGWCEKAHRGCECDGARSRCDYFRDIRTEHKRLEGMAPVMHNVNIIIKYREDGTYTIGWKKEMYGEQYGDYITCKADEPIEEKLPRVCEAFTDQISNLVDKIKKEKGGAE